jgi:hypothetical protein
VYQVGGIATKSPERLEVASTRLAPAGLHKLHVKLPDRRPWRAALAKTPGLDHCYRASVFVLGLVVVVGGAALWLFSTLLTTPVIFAGLWIWSWEFVWAKRLMHKFGQWADNLWRRVKRRPKRWTVVTALGILSGAAVWWGMFEFGLV